MPVVAGAAGALAALGGLAAAQPALGAAAAAVPCSVPGLISAITAADSAGGGTITLARGCTYTLTAVNNSTDGPTGLPFITGKITVQGNGATITRSTTAKPFRLFAVAAGGSLSLNSVRLSNGLADSNILGGGAVYSTGPLSVSGSTFTGNSAPSPTGSSGGAINASGPLTVANSTFTGNTAQEGGAILTQSTATVTGSTFSRNTGTIYGGGALLVAAGTTTVTGDTFSGNTTGASGGGGAIDNDTTVHVGDSTFTGNTGGTNGGGALQNFGTMTLSYATLSGDSSPYGAEIHNDPAPGASLRAAASIVANGRQGSNCGGPAPLTDGGYNLDSGSSCGFSAASGSLSNASPRLGPLASNGGPTQTMALSPSSPAVNAIPASAQGCAGSTDQRGVRRPQGTGCDIGAYELIQVAGVTGAVTGYGGKCLDDYHASTANGTKIDLYSCNGTRAQAWAFQETGTTSWGTYLGRLVNAASNRCLNDAGYGGPGTKVIQWTCGSYANELWQYWPKYREYSLYSGPTTVCLNDPGYSTANGTQQIVWNCPGTPNEQYSLPG
jgi:hypothetical protein